jgi:hypothetical protein
MGSTTQVTKLLSVNFSAPSGAHSIRWVVGSSDVHEFEQLHATPIISLPLLSHSGAFLYLFSFFLYFVFHAPVKFPCAPILKTRA